MVTVAPVAGLKVMGALAVPECHGATSPLYVPAETTTVWPATATLAALTIVQNGSVAVPEPESEQLDVRTYSVVVAAATGAAARATSAVTPAAPAAVTRRVVAVRWRRGVVRGMAVPLVPERGEC